MVRKITRDETCFVHNFQFLWAFCWFFGRFGVSKTHIGGGGRFWRVGGGTILFYLVFGGSSWGGWEFFFGRVKDPNMLS